MFAYTAHRFHLLLAAVSLVTLTAQADPDAPAAKPEPWETTLAVDELEYRLPSHRGRDELGWDLGARIGNEIEGIEVTFDGDAVVDGPNSVSTGTEVLYSRRLSDRWQGQIGVEYVNTWTPSEYTDRWSGVLVAGFDSETGLTLAQTLYLSQDGDLLFELEADYIHELTERIAVESGVDLVLAPDDIPRRSIGAGATETELDLLFVYDTGGPFAPYMGLRYIASLGDTRDIADAAGDDTDQLFLLVGTRIAF